ncbi:DivIVA domain-containing protein [Kineococcus gynurae]|uniref:DivIVA domain-containing protein n=1 Tax=Kineococcus gynurae TaxID=452979 RepID=A0ABV5LVK1_9ACTN
MTETAGEQALLQHALARRPARTGRWRTGYCVEDVDAFLEHAGRSAPAGTLTSAQVRAVGFASRRGGYDIEETDDVLAAIEDQLVRRERTRALGAGQSARWAERAAALSAAIYGRLGEPAGDRFPRERRLRRGYRPADVDDLCDLLADHLDGREHLTPEDLRRVLFRPSRGRFGYREGPVDAFVDRVVELLVAFER